MAGGAGAAGAAGGISGELTTTKLLLNLRRSLSEQLFSFLFELSYVPWA